MQVFNPSSFTTPIKRRSPSPSSEDSSEPRLPSSPYKTLSVGSTIDSPLLAGRMELLDIDHSYSLYEQEQPQLCRAFWEEGFCMRGASCQWSHSWEKEKQHLRKKLGNFPELAAQGCRVRSFLQ